jgi:hypothetical protein
VSWGWGGGVYWEWVRKDFQGLLKGAEEELREKDR